MGLGMNERNNLGNFNVIIIRNFLIEYANYIYRRLSEA